ncbi:hypothetical protein AB0I72_27565 [Nocardiopsis sp. NPDC049922]|uniref:hypothetical protein n=1 Tax=Nocardiopsis sp. NPDC049922 TaxID=3155157 RepID=UPI0034005A46
MKRSNRTRPGLPNPGNPPHPPLNPALAHAVERYRLRRGIPTGPVPPLPQTPADTSALAHNGLDALLAIAHQVEGGQW